MIQRLILACAFVGTVLVTTPLAHAQTVPPGTPAVAAPGPTAPGIPIGTPMPGAPVEPLAVPPVTPSPIATPTAAAQTGRRLAAFGLAADRIVFYSNRYIVAADGHVAVVLGDGTRVRGNTFAMDLRLNRFVIAGDVKVVTAATSGTQGKEIDGAAFAEYFDFDRAYFVPILGEPDRWTFDSGDYAHPLLGRQMPGDTFFLPDLEGERAFLTAKHATIDPHQSVRFTPADLNFGLATVPFPSYFLNFSPNPNFAQNALAGAYVDGPLDFLGGAHALSTLHLRYDPANKVYPAFEQHLVSANSYVVASVNPITRPLKQYNILAFDRLSPGMQISLALQETAFQHGFSRPLSATGYASAQLVMSLPQSYVTLTTQNYYDSLLAKPREFTDSTTFGRVFYYGDPTHPFIGDHPSQQQLAWVGFRHPIAKLPFTFSLRSGLSAATNSTTKFGTLGGVNVSSLFSKSFGINIASKSIKVIPDSEGRGRDLYLTASFDKQRTFNSTPHFIDTQQESFALTKVIDPRRLTVLATYQIGNTGDFYGARQSDAYPSSAAVNPYTGEVIDGYRAFRGFATTHAFTQQLIFTPNDLLTLNVTMRENRDFPRAIPGLPTPTGNPFLGSTALGFANYGATPYQADLDLRYRINRLLTIDIGRSYYFNFGGYERWSPTFSFSIVK